RRFPAIDGASRAKSEQQLQSEQWTPPARVATMPRKDWARTPGKLLADSTRGYRSRLPEPARAPESIPQRETALALLQLRTRAPLRSSPRFPVAAATAPNRNHIPRFPRRSERSKKRLQPVPPLRSKKSAQARILFCAARVAERSPDASARVTAWE